MAPVDPALREEALRLARQRIAEGLHGDDAHVVQAVRALDDLNEAYNVITGRMAEWHGVRHPESRLRPAGLVEHALAPGAENEADDDAAALRGLAQAAKELFVQKKALEAYLQKSMAVVAPNLSAVMGATLGARLIAHAGSLERLARMPASRIQVMGAGEALFSHLKSGTPPPKHGLILMHPLVGGAPKRARGRIARMLAGKAAIAARVDLYSGRPVDLGDLRAKASAIRNRARRGKGP